jgi:hypothetical protein
VPLPEERVEGKVISDYEVHARTDQEMENTNKRTGQVDATPKTSIGETNKNWTLVTSKKSCLVVKNIS